MVSYEEAVGLLDQLSLVDKVRLLGRLSTTIKHDIESEAHKRISLEPFIDLTFGNTPFQFVKPPLDGKHAGTSSHRSMFVVLADFLATNPTPQEIVNYRVPEDLQTRAHELLDLNRQGQLGNNEREELQSLATIDSLMSLLKAKIRLKLLNKSS